METNYAHDFEITRSSEDINSLINSNKLDKFSAYRMYLAVFYRYIDSSYR